MACEDLVEVLEMSRFLVVHVLHEWSQMRVCFVDRRRLSSIDQGGCELAGMVDAEGGVEELLLFGRELLSAWALSFVKAGRVGFGRRRGGRRDDSTIRGATAGS